MWAARQLGDIIEIPQADIDKLNDRYQNVYGPALTTGAHEGDCDLVSGCERGMGGLCL